jgi:DHA3 family tetracycline resistance protein-like MFS transporter
MRLSNLTMKKLNAYPVYLILEGASALFFTLVFTVNLVYQITTAGLNPLQLVLVGTVLELTVLVCEVPTGLVADVYSRRLSVIIGMFLIGTGLMLEGAIPRFATILLAQVLWGLGATFTSGATEAWIADEIGEAKAGQAYLRGAQAGQLGSFVGIGGSVLLASWQLNLPILVGGALFIALGLFLLMVMPEHGFAPTPAENHTSWQAMAQTMREGIQVVRRRPVLLTILTIGVIYGMFSEGLDRLWTAHLLNNFTLPTIGQFEPVVWFGNIDGVAILLSIGITEITRRRLDTNSHRSIAQTLFAINALLLTGVIAFGLANNFTLALACLWIISPLREMNAPLQAAWINRGLDSKIRATVLSLRSQADAFGQIAGGPVIGAIGTVFSLRIALVGAGLALLPALPLYTRTIRQRGQAPLEELPEIS